MLQISQTTLAKFGTNASQSDSTSKKCSNSAFPTSKHQKTSDLEVSDDLENLSVRRISKFEEVLTQHKGELMPISRLCPKF